MSRPQPAPLLASVFALSLAASLVGCGDPTLRRGHDALGQGRYAEAVEAFEDARRRLPPEAVPLDALAGAHRALAAEHLDRGRCDDGRRHLALAERHSPPLLADHRALYICAAARHAPPAVRIADLERLLALGDRRPEVRHTLMRLLLDAGRDADAVAHVPALERRFALTLADHQALIGAWERTGHPLSARPHVLKVLEADPHDLLARFKLAELDEAEGDIAAAEAIYRDLARRHPDNPVVFMRLGAFHTRRGDAPAARTAYLRARQLQGGVGADPRGDLRPLPKSRR